MPGPLSNSLHVPQQSKSQLPQCGSNARTASQSPVGEEGADAQEPLAHRVQSLGDAHQEQVVGLLRVELRQLLQKTGDARIVCPGGY